MESKILLQNICKSYRMYNSPQDQLKEALSIRGKSYHTEFQVLNNISFEITQGTILGIMGKNGAGKSTLLKIITGVLEPSSGELHVSGKISSLLELGAGFNMEYNGIDNIYFYGMLMKLTRQQIDAKIDDIISFAEIGDYIYQPVKTYSSGMFARLAFSCAINVDPDILIVDEILSVGDIRFQSKCFNKFKEFKEKGVTIIYVGHDVGLMKSFCDEAFWLHNGEIIERGDPSEVAAKYVEFMYLDDSSDFTAYKRKSSKDAASEPEDTKKSEEDADVCSQFFDHKLYQGAITHWGIKPGMIKDVFLTNESGKEIDYFAPEDIIVISFIFEVDDTIDLETLSLAFSIKNKEGTDLIVKTTYDEALFIKGGNAKQYCISFRLRTLLAVGEYYLVVAIENRAEMNPIYYEYIEGAKYFKVFTNKKIFGKVDLPAEIEIKETENPLTLKGEKNE